ncbi:MAG: hypothetical protein JSS86_09305 [Cyanobacteria bacterium SZAS LIN-2]|nr:hypothetical protein [Cyanobacteria bacterium SZAS LIN-3]MBS1996495.1 hypothetical protein [Cyanobacteria bacterium SZAS LIN-2]MBS2005859.1 hypothetical protein [Cyanobacteria bacterium SZAS TMP-1]
MNKFFNFKVATFTTATALTIVAGLCSLQVLAAEDLKLKKGISFTDDGDSGFPIDATKMEDMQLDPNKVTFIFYGASGDLNTNRQAKRLVDLYKSASNKAVKFILIDVDHPINAQATALIKSHYKGYIPFEVILDKTGKVVWSQIGEVENGVLNQQLDRALAIK